MIHNRINVEAYLPVHVLLVCYVRVQKQCIVVVVVVGDGDGVRDCMEPDITEVIFMAINDQTQ